MHMLFWNEHTHRVFLLLIFLSFVKIQIWKFYSAFVCWLLTHEYIYLVWRISSINQQGEKEKIKWKNCNFFFFNFIHWIIIKCAWSISFLLIRKQKIINFFFLQHINSKLIITLSVRPDAGALTSSKFV